MKIIALATAALIGIASLAGTALAADGPTCLQSQFIDHTHTVNPSTVLFYMRDGKIWRNDLPQPCPGLNFYGFVVQGHDSEICGGQGINIIKAQTTCTLGKNFTTYLPPPNHSSP
jgi:hypothetical protein